MITHLKYGIETGYRGNGRIAVEVPDHVWGRIEEARILRGFIENLSSKQGLLNVIKQEGGQKLLINDKRIGPMKDTPKRQELLKQTLAVLAAADHVAGGASSFGDPRMSIRPDVRRQNNGRALEPRIT